MSEFQRGDTVSVTFEGKITYINRSDDRDTYDITMPGEETIEYIPPDFITLVKKIPPVLNHGDVVLDTDGGVYFFVAKDGKRFFSAEFEEWPNITALTRQSWMMYDEDEVEIDRVIGKLEEK